MVPADEHRDRLIDVLLREQLGAEQPPDLEDRILARAFPSRRRRWALAATAAAAAAAVLLVVGLVLTVVPKYPRRATSSRLPAPSLAQARTTVPPRPRISTTVRVPVRVPVRSVSPFRIPGRIPIPTGRVRIPSFSVRLPQSVLPFTTTTRQKRSPS